MTDAAVFSGEGAPLPLALFRPLAAPLVEAIVRQVQDEVPAYAEGRCQLLGVATRAGVRGFLEGGPAQESDRRKLDELFQRLGHGEAQQGKSPDPMVTALRVATRCAWDHLADFAVAQQYSAKALRDISTSLLNYTDHLRAQLLAGYDLGSRFTDRSRTSARMKLLDFFFHSTFGRVSALRPLGTDPEELLELAGAAGWPVPERVVALAVSFHGEPPELPDRADVLTRVVAGRVVAVCPEDEAEGLATLLKQSGPDRRVAISWPVRTAETGSALLWTARALDLVRLGVVPPTSTVRCTEHVTQLWLHAEPSMRQRLCQELLEPLLAETPNSREILSDTLLAWLETRDSAPAIAARLDVHPQTVRYRWKRINELFGDALHDPEFVLQVTMVLKTSLPMWKAGDQSDFDRFRDRRLANP
jgi:hypothetical protein